MITVSRNGATVELQKMRIDVRACPSFPTKYGSKVKDLGGSYSRITQFDSIRFVFLPVTEEGIALADAIIRDYRPMYYGAGSEPRERAVTIVFESALRKGVFTHLPSGLSVQQMRKQASVRDVIFGDFALALERAVDHRIFETDANLEKKDEQRRQDVARRAREDRIFQDAPEMLALLRDILANTDGSREGELRVRARVIVNRIDGVNAQEVA